MDKEIQSIKTIYKISIRAQWAKIFKNIDLINEDKIFKDDIRFFLGYSGWDAKQLEKELHANSWVLSENVYKTAIIQKSDKAFWKKKMLELGDNYSIWSNAPEDPSFN